MTVIAFNLSRTMCPAPMSEQSSHHKSCSKKFAKARIRQCILEHSSGLPESLVIPLQPEDGVSVNHILFNFKTYIAIDS